MKIRGDKLLKYSKTKDDSKTERAAEESKEVNI